MKVELKFGKVSKSIKIRSIDDARKIAVLVNAKILEKQILKDTNKYNENSFKIKIDDEKVDLGKAYEILTRIIKGGIVSSSDKNKSVKKKDSDKKNKKKDNNKKKNKGKANKKSKSSDESKNKSKKKNKDAKKKKNKKRVSLNFNNDKSLETKHTNYGRIVIKRHSDVDFDE